MSFPACCFSKSRPPLVMGLLVTFLFIVPSFAFRLSQEKSASARTSADHTLNEILEKDRRLETTWKWTLGVASLFLLAAGISYYQKFRIRKVYLQELEEQNTLIKEQKEEIETINQQLEKQILLRKETDDTINYFATSLFGKNTIEEVLWDVAKNCIARLGLVDCVIYLLDEKRGVLVQKAAYGHKNPEEFNIYVPIEIPLGKGIVGSVATSAIAEIIDDASQDSRYIVDDQPRLSELAVPLTIRNKVIGVIDSEHPEKNFFTRYHLDALTTIASICASKISQAQADEKAIRAKEAQKEAEQIKKLEQLKSQFFANISHEFRTPLNLILAPLQKQCAISPTEIKLMSRNAKRLLRLVNELLELAKMEVGLIKAEMRNIDVFGFIKDIANSFVLLAEAKSITYLIQVPERNYIVRMDPGKLEKIVYNLLSNAFKFTPRTGVIIIQAQIDAVGNFQLKISDSGIGIQEELHPKIFQRFYQVDGSQTRAFEGTGIGLALTKELIDLLQGTITVDSQLGKGSTFTILLPTGTASEEPADISFTSSSMDAESYYFNETEESAPALKETISENRPVVLLVEDNKDLRNYTKTELSGQFMILEASNGEEGFTLAHKKIPDLIVTDIMMPVMDGVTLVKNLRDDERTSHIPIILLTARDDGETKIRGFETGAEQYLVKPFDIQELMARIKSLLNQGERLRKKFSREFTLEPAAIALPNKDAVFLEKIIKTIEANMSNEDFTVEQLHADLGMSRMQLHRKLKALTNQSASDFIRSIRLKRAAQILRQPGIQVAEAAYGSGFNHMSYFSKCFKEQFGVLPSEFGKQME